MSINKKYIMTGMLATALVVPMTNAINSYADDIEVMTLSSTNEKYVNASSGLNVRKGPSTSYAVITKLSNGTKVTVKSTSGEWSKITSGNITGYVSNKYLSSSTSNNNSSETLVTKYVNASANLNVRKGPSTSYAVITKLSNGTKVTVKSTSNGWSKITSGNITGYVSDKYLSSNSVNTGGTSNNNSSEISETKYVNASANLNVRKGPSTSYAVITKLSNGTKVTVKSTSNGWSKITSGNITGYVSSSYLTSKAPNTGSSSNSSSSTTASANKVISYAKSLVGKPYIWGAQGPNGFDCSGFTYYVFKNAAGISLPRTASQQSKFGIAVSKSNLKPGDLVFFDTVGSNNGVVTHCGIYIGNGQLIHAASGQGKVVINNMNSSYYVKAYVNARRVL